MYEEFRMGSKIRKIRNFWGGIRKSGKSARVGPLQVPGFWSSVPGARCLELGVRCMELGARRLTSALLRVST